MKCPVNLCSREGRFLNSWKNNNSARHFGIVCAIHDRQFAHINLQELAGMSSKEAKLFDLYLIETVNSPHPSEWFGWLKTHQIHLATVKRTLLVEDLILDKEGRT